MSRALVLAAGRSTRIQAVTRGGPKPLLELGGKSVLEHNLTWLAASGIRQVTINLHYRAEEIQERIGNGQRLGLDVQYLWEPQLLGTAGAYRNYCQHFGSDPCWVVYGDNFLCFDLGKMRAVHEQAGVPLTLALFDEATQPHTGIAGGRVVVDADQRVLAFVEEGDTALSTLVNAGVYRVEPSMLHPVPAEGAYDFARDLFPALLASGQSLLGYRIDGYCLGLDTPESLARARQLLGSGKVVAP